MKKLTNRGFGKVEIMAGLCTLIILMVVAMKVFSDNNSNSNYSMFKKQAEEFSYRVGIYKDMYSSMDNAYYLDDLLLSKYSINLQNPFNKSEDCDRYESYVVIKNGKRQTNLKCGEYLAESDYDGNYYIYKLSSWQESKVDGETKTLYNYSKNGVEMSDKYMLEKEFIAFYNKTENEEIYYIDDIDDDDIDILEKTMYRKKELVKEFSDEE